MGNERSRSSERDRKNGYVHRNSKRLESENMGKAEQRIRTKCSFPARGNEQCRKPGNHRPKLLPQPRKLPSSGIISAAVKSHIYCTLQNIQISNPFLFCY